MLNNSCAARKFLAVCRRLHSRLGKAMLPGWKAQVEFALLVLLTERLDPRIVDSADLGYFRNWLSTARGLWESGEVGAARYQLAEIGHKLRTRVSA